jgi:hypothetical protein
VDPTDHSEEPADLYEHLYEQSTPQPAEPEPEILTDERGDPILPPPSQRPQKPSDPTDHSEEPADLYDQVNEMRQPQMVEPEVEPERDARGDIILPARQIAPQPVPDMTDHSEEPADLYEHLNDPSESRPAEVFSPAEEEREEVRPLQVEAPAIPDGTQPAGDTPDRPKLDRNTVTGPNTQPAGDTPANPTLDRNKMTGPDTQPEGDRDN